VPAAVARGPARPFFALTLSIIAANGRGALALARQAVLAVRLAEPN
jgi:hypothetical protein